MAGASPAASSRRPPRASSSSSRSTFASWAFAPWEYKTAPQTAGDAFEWLHKIDRGDADLVIGFTMVPFPGPRGEIRGVTQYFSQYVVIPDCWGTTGATTRLVHELCHVFGAFHVAATDSVMQLGFERTPKTFRFGEPTEETDRIWRRTSTWRKGSTASRRRRRNGSARSIRAIHHPLEDVDDDPIVVGYRYQAHRAGWAGDTERSQQMQRSPIGCPAAPNCRPAAEWIAECGRPKNRLSAARYGADTTP